LAIPEIFHTQTKKNPQTNGAKSRTFRSSLLAVRTLCPKHSVGLENVWVEYQPVYMYPSKRTGAQKRDRMLNRQATKDRQ